MELEALPVAAVRLRDGSVVVANDAALALLTGGTDDEAGRRDRVVGRPLTDVLDPLRRRDPGLDLEAPTSLARTDGGAVVEVRPARPSADDTRLVVLLDVTARARAEGIVGLLGDSTIVLTPDGMVRWQSGDVARLADEGHGGGVGRSPLELVHPEDLPTVLDTFVRAVNRPGRRFTVAARSQALGEGNWQRVDITGVSAPDVPGIEGIVSQVRNVGAGRQVNSLAADGEFLSLTDAAPVGLVVGDLFGRTVYSNPEARRLLRIDDAQAEEVDWVDLLAPEARDRVRAAIDDAIFEGRTRSDTVRVEHADRSVSWLRVNVSPRMAAGQQAVGIITTLDDVTSEVEARAEAARLKEMLDASSDFVVVFRPGEGPLYTNSAYRQLIGAKAEAFAESGERPAGRLLMLIPEDMREQWLEGARAVMASEDVWRGDFEFEAADGSRIPVSTLVVVRRDDDGQVDWVAVLARDISELKAAEHRLREAATHDHLTGLPNRPLFIDRLDQAVARHRRTRSGLAVLFCDLDGFKEINDTYGHAAGDELLTIVAQRLREIVRETDTAARVGGDEFVIVAEGVTDTEVLATLAERIIDTVSQRVVTTGGEQLRVGISVGIGVAFPRNNDVEADALLTLADSAMYRAKARGGNRYRIMPLALG